MLGSKAMKLLLWLFLLLACASVAAEESRYVVGSGDSSVCMADRETARRYATTDARADAYERCGAFGEGWELREQWQLPGNARKGNPRELVQCAACNTAGANPVAGFKCSVRMLPQVCARPSPGQAAAAVESNADWNAKDRSPGSAQAMFTYGGRTVSCAEAVKYRDAELFAGMGAALNSFDAAREKRLRDALAKFDADLAALTKDLDGADRRVLKKLAVIAAGLAIGHAASAIAGAGLKTGASAIERRGMDIVAARGAEWVSVFMDFKLVSKEIDAVAVTAMPVTVILALSPAAPVAWVWSAGTTGIGMAEAFAERALVRDEANLTAAIIRKRAHDLLAKFQMPKIAALNAMKNEIDSQCNRRN